jgi:uncharacterized protein YeaO (DUF488 family)
MTSIAIKRAYEPPAKSDGKRYLVDRLWPRGVRKADAKLDGWWKELAPSPGLRKWFGHKPERFLEFKRRYNGELRDNPELKPIAKSLKGKITLVYGARDPKVNHATVLATALRRRR